MLSLWNGYWGEWELQSKLTFDGPSKLITVNPGVTTLDIKTELYSDWVDWVAIRDNSMFLPAMRYTGLDPIPGGESGDIYFLQNGWRLVINLAAVRVTGVLYSDDYDSAYYDSNLNAVYPAVVSALVNNSQVSEVTATVDIDAIAIAVAAKFAEPGMTTAGIANAVEGKFQFNADGHVLSEAVGVSTNASIDEKTLNRVVQGAIPPPPSNGAIAQEIVRIIGKPRLYDKEFSAIEQRLAKLAKPAPQSSDTAEIKQMLRIMMADKPVQENVQVMERINNVYTLVDQLPKAIPQSKDYERQLMAISIQLDTMQNQLSDEAESIRAEVQAIPEPDLSQIATTSEIQSLRALISKLSNYDDTETQNRLEALTETLAMLEGNTERTERKVDLVLDNTL